MNKIHLIHTADWHLSEKEKNKIKARKNLDQMLEYSSENNVDGLIIAGDLWDRIQPFGNDSAIKLAYEYLDAFAKVMKFIFIIKGNSFHDAPQSVELLNNFRDNIITVEKNAAIGFNLKNKCEVNDLFESTTKKEIDLLIHGIAYPNKIFTESYKGIDIQNEIFLDHFNQLLEFHGSISNTYQNVPKLTVFHGNVMGAKLSSGQIIIGQELVIPTFTIEKTGSNYYALGHIHLPQNIKSNIRYSGSLYNKDFGEQENKSYDTLELANDDINVTTIKFKQNRPMITVEAEFKDGKILYDKNIPKGAELKFKCRISEKERSLLTDEIISNMKNEYGSDVKIEYCIIPVEISARSTEIMKAKTLLEEVKEYMRLINEEYTLSLEEKLIALETELMVELR